MNPTPTTPRLFAHGPAVTPTESRQRTAINRGAQLAWLELDRPSCSSSSACPACAGIDDCTCARTGAEAIPLDL